MKTTPDSKRPAAAAHLIPVRFEFDHPTATTVSIAGSFNHWQPGAKAMQQSGCGHWSRDTALAPGSYEYCLVVDGQWMPDPLARDTVPNPYGGRNSILHVGATPGATHRDEAVTQPMKCAT